MIITIFSYVFMLKNKAKGVLATSFSIPVFNLAPLSRAVCGRLEHPPDMLNRLFRVLSWTEKVMPYCVPCVICNVQPLEAANQANPSRKLCAAGARPPSKPTSLSILILYIFSCVVWYIINDGGRLQAGPNFLIQTLD